MTVSRETAAAPRIEVTEHGPYRVSGDVAIRDAEGNLLRHGGTWCLCRCGGSRNKPFCDATHGVKGFDGAETADHGSIADRREAYRATDITVYDDYPAMALVQLDELSARDCVGDESRSFDRHRRVPRPVHD